MKGTFLGKIESIKFGIDGSRIGLFYTLAFNSSSEVQSSNTVWDPEQIKVTQYTKWTESERDKHLAELMRYISKLLADAKVDDVTKLVGKPIELTINEHNSLESWRILTEVL
jgi:hypothetical protein